MDNSETHYVSFLNGEGDDGLENGELHQRRGVRAGGVAATPYVVTTRTYFWKKFLRQRNFKTRAWIALVAAAVSLLVFASFLIQWQGDDDRGVFPPSPVEDHKTPVNIWEWKEEHFQNAFGSFRATYGKSYATEEETQKRYAIFKNNLAYIHTHNQQGYSYSLKMNHFGDLSREEFRRKYLGYNKSRNLKSNNLGVATELLKVSPSDVPSAVDWREKGCVTPVKDQRDCGSCWAFSATGALEGAHCAKTGELLSLSEQELVDCSLAEGNQGCSGGEMNDAFQYVVDSGGLCSEEGYPYLARDGECKRACKKVVTISGFKDVPRKSETAMKAALAHSPVSIAIEADQLPFQFYHEGVFDASCGTDLDHGVLLVGYGTDKETKKDFWIMKNSWGSGWGRDGYMYMAMHKGEETVPLDF
ncbi:cathepsin L, related [Neospora caninum Liverpool]|uniref:Cathepsin L, related n=1 Tax=Neospora caninum (strain Liverpool) TaxID=572307 RepID=F0V8B3_NEOCL|nr:cathepsin L, related [Neospora caninum Liverpool]CBZ49954.1 cathepsin L, related [Neospora caninum Liverpool]|eukprot:XP_003879989.1 cathepsin L, related [Neospora caninum Liverpool]